MRRALLYTCLILCSAKVYGQNIVPNASFEDKNACPGGFNGSIVNGITYSANYSLFPTATSWVTPFTEAEDCTNYYNTCATTTSGYNVPNTNAGYHNAHTGNACVGIYAVWGEYIGGLQENSFAGYIQAKLTNVMQAGHQYYGNFYVSRASGFPYNGQNIAGNGFNFVSTDQVGMLFTDTMLTDDPSFTINSLDYAPSISNPQGNYITDTLNWIKVQGFYTAQGGEQWLTVGAFLDSNIVNLWPVMTAGNYTGGGVNNVCFLFIDDVCVTDAVISSHDSVLCHETYPLVLNAPVHPDAPNRSWITGDTTTTISVNDTGTYWIRSTGDCVYYIDTIKLIHTPAPVINWGPNPPQVCNGWPVQLAVTGGQSYVWSPATGLSCDSCSSPIADPATTTTYTVTATSDLGCTSTSQVTVGVNNVHAQFSMNSDSLCVGNALILTNTSTGDSLTYLWSFGDGNNSDSFNATHVYNTTGIDSVTLLVNNNGCADSATQLVYIYTPPAISFSIPDSLGCIGKPFLLNSNIPGGYVSLLWNFGDSTRMSGTTVTNHTYERSGDYDLTLSVTYPGCPAVTISDSLIVFPNPSVEVSDTIICQNVATTILNVAGDTITWYMSAGDTVGSAIQPVINTNVITTDTLFVASSNYCGVSDKKKFTVSIAAPPVLTNDTIALCNGQPVPLTAYGMYAQYLWSTGDTTCCITIDNGGVYTVHVNNVCGAVTDTTDADQTSCNACIWVPNAFTPNGDGRNDILYAINLCTPFRYFNMIITNRWGQTIFESLDIKNGWDGTFNGRPVDVGTYYYLIKVYVAEGAVPSIVKGDITVIR